MHMPHIEITQMTILSQVIFQVRKDAWATGMEVQIIQTLILTREIGQKE